MADHQDSTKFRAMEFDTRFVLNKPVQLLIKYSRDGKYYLVDSESSESCDAVLRKSFICCSGEGLPQLATWVSSELQARRSYSQLPVFLFDLSVFKDGDEASLDQVVGDLARVVQCGPKEDISEDGRRQIGSGSNDESPIYMGLYAASKNLAKNLARSFIECVHISANGENVLKQFQCFMCYGGDGAFPAVPQIGVVILHQLDQKPCEVTVENYAACFGSMEQSNAWQSLATRRETTETCQVAPAYLLFNVLHRDSEEGLVPGSKSWFIQLLSEVVNTGVAQSPYGVKHDFSHVHIGSKVHLGAYYGCVSLFQNAGIAKTMAYYLAHKVVNDVSDYRGPVFLYGYEGYSALVIKEAVHLINQCQPEHMNREDQSAEFKYKDLILARENGEILNIDGLAKAYSQEASGDSEGARPLILPVIPVATTLSTVRKMLDVLYQRLSDTDTIRFPGMSIFKARPFTRRDANGPKLAKKTLNKLVNLQIACGKAYAMVLVAPEGSLPGDVGSPSERFWRVLSEGNEVGLRIPQYCEKWPTDDASAVTGVDGAEQWIHAEVFVHAKQQWYDPLEDNANVVTCPCCAPAVPVFEQVLLSFDEGETIPRVEFASADWGLDEVPKSDAVFKAHIEDDVKGLYGYTVYGHILDGPNHFQHYIDVPRLMNHLRSRSESDLLTWTEEVANDVSPELLKTTGGEGEGSPNPLSIVVAPYDNESSGFFPLILGSVFKRCPRYVHVDLDHLSIDELVEEYAHLISELREAKQLLSEVRFYYMQTCISSGKTLEKGEMVARTLAVRAGRDDLIGGVAESIFYGVICLVDRSSHSVPLREKRRWAFMRVNAPSLGIDSPTCQICESAQAMRSVARITASNELASEFIAYANKLEPKTLSQQRKDLEKKILTSSRVAAWTLECFRDLKRPKEKADAFGCGRWALPDEASEVAACRVDEIEELLKSIGADELRSLLDLRTGKVDTIQRFQEMVLDGRRALERFARDCVIAARDYMRLCCEHQFGNAFGLDVDLGSINSSGASRVLPIYLFPDSSQSAEGCVSLDGECGLVSRSVELLARRLGEIARSVGSDYLFKEWIISSLKTLSRGRFVQMHHIRQATLTVCLFLIEAIVADRYTAADPEPGNGERSWISRKASNLLRGVAKRASDLEDPSFRLQIVRAIVNRLADVQSLYLFRFDRLQRVFKYLSECAEEMAGTAVGETKYSCLHEFEYRIRLDTEFCQAHLRLSLMRAIKRGVLNGDDETRILFAGRAGIAPLRALGGGEWDAASLMHLELGGVLLTGIERMWGLWDTVPVREALLGIHESNRARKSSDSSLNGSADGEGAPTVCRNIKVSALKEAYAALPDRAKESTPEGFAAFCDRNQEALYRRCARSYLRAFIASQSEHDAASGEISLLRSSPIRRFFEFVKWEYGLEPRPAAEAVAEACAPMFLLYKYANDLVGGARVPIEQQDRVYVYEEICGCVRDALGGEDCIAVYRRGLESHVLVRSSARPKVALPQDCAEIVLDRIKGAGLLSDDGSAAACSGSGTSRLVTPLHADGVSGVLPAKTDQDSGVSGKFVWVRVDPLDSSTGKADGSVYFIVQFAEAEGAQNCFRTGSALKVLFARDLLSRALREDLALLMGSLENFESVRQLTPYDNKIGVLHISDFHAKDDPSDDMGDIAKALLNERRFGLEDSQSDRYDLIAITGDVAQAERSPREMINNYKCASRFIRCLVYYLWADVDGYLRPDWTKRVLITTGNHDYSAASGLRTVGVRYRRISELAVPERTPTTVAAQFHYFVDFLYHTLGCDPAPVFRRGLDQVRNYDRLGMSFILLNTSALAGPLRNNKVGVATSLRPEWLVTQITRGNDVVCLAHHGPAYRIDYVEDEYFDLSYLNAVGTSELLVNLRNAFERYLSSVIASPIEVPKCPQRDISACWVQSKLLKKGLSQGTFEECRDIRQSDYENSDLYRLLMSLEDLDGRSYCSHEGVASVASQMQCNRVMSDHDQVALGAFYQELVNEVHARLFDPKGPFGEHYVVLSGHTHIGSKEEKGRAVPYWQYTVGRLREDLTLERVDGAGASSDPVFCASKILRGEQVDVSEANKVPAVRYSELVCGGGLVSEGEEWLENPRRSGYSYHGVLLREGGGSQKLDRFDLEIVAESEKPETCTYRTERWVLHKEEQRGEKCDAGDSVTDEASLHRERLKKGGRRADGESDLSAL